MNGHVFVYYRWQAWLARQENRYFAAEIIETWAKVEWEGMDG